jgi:hypothetical protein
MASKPTKPSKPAPRLHSGRPAGGKHVPSRVPGAGAYDASEAVGQHVATGSNIKPAPGPDRGSPEVLQSPPWIAVNPNAAQWMPPIN